MTVAITLRPVTRVLAGRFTSDRDGYVTVLIVVSLLSGWGFTPHTPPRITVHPESTDLSHRPKAHGRWFQCCVHVSSRNRNATTIGSIGTVPRAWVRGRCCAAIC